MDSFKDFLQGQFSEYGNYNSKSLSIRLVEPGYDKPARQRVAPLGETTNRMRMGIRFIGMKKSKN